MVTFWGSFFVEDDEWRGDEDGQQDRESMPSTGVVEGGGLV